MGENLPSGTVVQINAIRLGKFSVFIRIIPHPEPVPHPKTKGAETNKLLLPLKILSIGFFVVSFLRMTYYATLYRKITNYFLPHGLVYEIPSIFYVQSGSICHPERSRRIFYYATLYLKATNYLLSHYFMYEALSIFHVLSGYFNV